MTLTTSNETLGRRNVPPLTGLHTMDITRLILTEGDILYFGSLAPNLRHLKLSSCFQYGDLDKKRYKQYIHLPENHPSTLTWQSENKIAILYRHTVDALITLAINGGPQRIYLSSPSIVDQDTTLATDNEEVL